MKTILTVLGAVLAFLWACQQQPGGFETLSVDDFRSLIDDPSVQRLDVRTTAEYTEGHIPGSLNINVLDSQFAPMGRGAYPVGLPGVRTCHRLPGLAVGRGRRGEVKKERTNRMG